MSHPESSKRHLTDIELSTRSVEWLYDLAEDCEIEPAEPSACDSCAAYVMAQQKSTKSAITKSELILQVVAEAGSPSIETLENWLRYGRNAARLNPATNGLSEWQRGWNDAIEQTRV